MKSTVLVADDSAVAREKLRRVLNGAKLFSNVVLAVDGDEALAVLRSERAADLDLVLCDLMMPGADGFALLEHVLGSPRLASIPVIVLTGHEDIDLKLRALEAGAADYLVKPFHDAELLARVRVHRHLKRLRDELEAANARLEELVVRDPLTGLFNRRQWSARLEQELELSRRTGRPLALLMADVDHFKRINDGLGHPVGDRVLEAVAEVLRTGVRGPDMVARLGGEEFGVLLPDSSLDDALIVAERLRRSVADMKAPVFAPGLDLRISLGATSVEQEAAVPDDPRDLTAAADRALYRAKREGRDRVCAEPLNAPVGG